VIVISVRLKAFLTRKPRRWHLSKISKWWKVVASNVRTVFVRVEFVVLSGFHSLEQSFEELIVK